MSVFCLSVLGRIDDRAILLSEFLVEEIHDLEDHPSGCKWLVTMVSKSPKWGCGTPSKWPKRLIDGVTSYLLTMPVSTLDPKLPPRI